MQMAGLGRLAAEHAKGQRADIDAARGIGREVVEAGRAGDGVERQQRVRRAVGQGDAGDVPAADHQAARLVQGHAADAAPLGHGQRDLAGAIEKVHAAIDDVAEVEATGGIPHRALDQAISCCNALHGVLPYAVDER